MNTECNNIKNLITKASSNSAVIAETRTASDVKFTPFWKWGFHNCSHCKSKHSVKHFAIICFLSDHGKGSSSNMPDSLTQSSDGRRETKKLNSWVRKLRFLTTQLPTSFELCNTKTKKDRTIVNSAASEGTVNSLPTWDPNITRSPFNSSSPWNVIRFSYLVFG